MSASPTIDSDELAWLHALARALVSSGESAEDLAQETALRALELERPEGAPARPWLASVMRGLRLNQRRADRRRSAREGRLEASSGSDAADSLVAQAETAASLEAAARELPEPQRGTVLQHFLEGLSVAEIARREGRPTDTVRWRLRRGLELLRERLVERSEKDWNWWMAALAPLARPVVPAAPTAQAVAGSVLILTVMKWSAVALVALALAWALVLSPWVSSTPILPDEFALESESARAAAEEKPTDRAPAQLVDVTSSDLADPERRSLDEGDAAASTEDARERIGGVVLDEAGRPIGGAIITLTDRDTSYKMSQRDLVPKATSLPNGSFEFDRAALLTESDKGDRPAQLNVFANGYRRLSLENALEAWDEGGWRIVMSRGQTLSGRVVTGDGLPVAGLEMVAFRAGMGIPHMSRTQRMRRVSLAQLVADEDDHICRATTGSDGSIHFEGLGDGDVSIAGLDPRWEIIGPLTSVAGSSGILWTAEACMGVIVDLVGPGSGSASVSAAFFVEVTDAEGATDDLGQWVGRGDSQVSMSLTPTDLSMTPSAIRFHGTLTVGQETAEWTSETLTDLPAVARVEIDIRDLDPDDPEGGIKEPDAIPMRDVVLDVRRVNGTFVEAGAVYVEWTDPKTGRDDGKRAQAGEGPGRFIAELPEFAVELSVTEINAQGSIAPWYGSVPETQDGPVRVTLAAAGTLTVLRPPGMKGIWRVRLQRGDRPEGPWRGGWNYGTDEDRLTFSSVADGYWWVRIAPRENFDNPVEQHVVQVRAEEETIVGQ